MNGFFDRPVTFADISELPWPIEGRPQWTRSGAKQALFDTNYIPTIFINGNRTRNGPYDQEPSGHQDEWQFDYILANEVKTFN
ncbi:hypothetical protein BGZ65_012306, partial [Modicella reniformis]